jgi:hypothetical protein
MLMRYFSRGLRKWPKPRPSFRKTKEDIRKTLSVSSSLPEQAVPAPVSQQDSKEVSPLEFVPRLIDLNKGTL